ncbi:MAG: hypothetical protein VX438_02615 [Planctomycetota bacterium]|nr:hypothetical protein [Planctomycetota bacterium]
MNFNRAIIMAIVCWFGYLGHFGLGQDPAQNPENKIAFFDGIVKKRKKYSFTLQGASKDYSVQLNPLTVIAARLVRPTIDWSERSATVTIPMSAPDGRSKNNQAVDFMLPKRLFFKNDFATDGQRLEALARNPVELNSFSLTPVQQQPGYGNAVFPVMVGELVASSELGLFKTTIGGKEISVRPDLDTVRLEGFEISDLVPGRTEVFVNGDFEDGQVVAKRVEFVPLAVQVNRENPKLPRCLVIGDTVSFNYFPALHKELAGKVSLFHPHANCQGSINHSKFHRWLGLYREPEYQWDVIAFNFGHADSEMLQGNYQANLDAAIQKLKLTGAKLIWIESTPIPFGFNATDMDREGVIPEKKRFDFEFEEADAKKMVPGRMKLQNAWAAEVLKRYPEIQVCRTWQIVKENKSGRYDQWWYGKNPNFKFQQTIPLAKKIGSVILGALN